MRHLSWTPLAVLAVALCASPAAVAHDRHAGGGAVVTPSSPHQLAQWYKTFLEMPAAVNPLWGTGDDPCVRFGPGGKLLSAIAVGGEVTCTAELGTVLDTGWGHFCSTFDPPDSEFYAVGRREQRRCARAAIWTSSRGTPWPATARAASAASRSATSSRRGTTAGSSRASTASLRMAVTSASPMP